MDDVRCNDKCTHRRRGNARAGKPIRQGNATSELKKPFSKTGSRRSPDEVKSLHLTNVATQDKVDLEKDESDDVKPSLCQDILTRILILLCDTDPENACHNFT